jgi:outer membrane protein
MLKNVLVVALLGLSSTAFAGGFQVKVGGSVIAPTDETKIAGVGS